MCAADKCDTEMIDLLLAVGADVNKTDSRGQTALRKAQVVYMTVT